MPRLEARTVALRVALALVFLGGLGRLVSIAAIGLPGPQYIPIMLSELLAPLLALWQRRVAAP